jgi:hypothetical protein
MIALSLHTHPNVCFYRRPKHHIGGNSLLSMLAEVGMIRRPEYDYIHSADCRRIFLCGKTCYHLTSTITFTDGCEIGFSVYNLTWLL